MFGMYEFENSYFKCFFQSILCQMYHSLVDLLIGWRNRATPLANGAFKSCRIHRIYELNAHERHHKVVITSGKLEIFFKPRVSELWACQ